MGVEININFNVIGDIIEKDVVNGVNYALRGLKKYAEDQSPIDTGEYESNHKIELARVVNGVVRGALYNNTPYSEILEYGVRGITYGYHRYKKLYMAGVGARVYTRTLDNNKSFIEETIAKYLSKK